VPQGSILGPLLFILYINDIHKVTKNVKINLFADDTLMYYNGTDCNDVVNEMNLNLENITGWLKENKLKLNTEKTKAMVITNSSVTRKKFMNNIQHPICIENVEIEFVDEFKYLGVILDPHLTFDNHVNYIAKKIGKKIYYLARIGKYLNEFTKITLYKSLIAPHFEYCSTIFWEMSDKNMEVLQKLQNKAMRVILCCHKRTHIQLMLETLSWLSIKQRISFNTLLFVYKMKNNLLPPYLCKKLLKNSEVHEHYTRSCENFRIDQQHTAARDRSIYQSGVREFNKLPDAYVNEDRVAMFRRSLSKYVKKTFPFV
jgi:hypothetical protein